MAAWEKEYEKIKKQVEESTAKKKAAVQKIIQEQTDAAASAIEAQKRLYQANTVVCMMPPKFRELLTRGTY